MTVSCFLEPSADLKIMSEWRSMQNQSQGVFLQVEVVVKMRMTDRLKEILRFILPRTVMPYRILTGFLRGKIIYTSPHDYPAAIQGRTESALVAWMRRNIIPGETWLDIGAHYGYISLALSLLTGPDGRVFAFEPMLSTAGHLNQTRRVNHCSNLVILPLALGSNPGVKTARLPVTRGMADSTLKASRNYENILLFRLDDIWKGIAEPDEHISGVKIDVQGMELDVLTGMKILLENYKPKILLEFHSGVQRDAIISLMKSCGYMIPGFDISTDSQVRAETYSDNQTYLFIPELESS